MPHTDTARPATTHDSKAAMEAGAANTAAATGDAARAPRDSVHDTPSAASATDARATSEHRLLVPPTIGLALSSASFGLTVQNAYHGLSDPLLESGVMLASCAAAAALMIGALKAKRLNKGAVSLITFLAIHLSGIAALALTFLGGTRQDLPVAVAFILEAAVASGSVFLGFYWLRKLRGTSSAAVLLCALGGIAVGELVVLACGFIEASRSIATFICAFAQFGAVRASRSMDVPSDAFPALSETYLGTSEHRFSSHSFLAAAAFGICGISIPLGMGTAFPAGRAMPLEVGSCVVVTVVTLALVLVAIQRILRTPERSLAMAFWLAIDLVLAAGSVLLATGSGAQAGGALMIAASLLLRAFVWYLSVAFISFGTRDPYFYTAIAWIAMNVFTVLGRGVDLVLAHLAPSNEALVIAIMGLCTLVASHIVLTQLLNDPDRAQAKVASVRANTAETTAAHHAGGDGGAVTTSPATAASAARGPITQDDVRRIPLMGVMAIAPETEAPLPSATPDVHIATSVIEMGQRFGLSGREVEVLTLYALGHTQARVSEELQLSQNTVHTHIKRIYDKTDLHSRQEILDYINEYGR